MSVWDFNTQKPVMKYMFMHSCIKQELKLSVGSKDKLRKVKAYSAPTSVLQYIHYSFHKMSKLNEQTKESSGL